MHGCTISLLPRCGASRFGEPSLVIFDHVGRKFGLLSPILRWPFLPLLNAFDIHAPNFGDFYHCITDESQFG